MNDTTKTFNLQEEAILVSLSIGQAGLSARSRTATHEIAKTHNADPNSVRGIVTILDAGDRAEITQAINQARAALYMNTLPWDDNGYRLCPLTRYAKLRKELGALNNAFMDAVSALTSRYEELREDYHRRVGDLAQEIPFPSRAELERSFRFELVEMPLANPNDVRLRHVDSDVVNEIREKTSRLMGERLREAQTDIIEKLVTLVERVKVQASKEKGRIFESLVENVEEMVAIAPALNISNDPEINRLVAKVKAEIGNIDIERLRRDNGYRSATATTAEDVLRDLGKFRSSKVTLAPVQHVNETPQAVVEQTEPIEPEEITEAIPEPAATVMVEQSIMVEAIPSGEEVLPVIELPVPVVATSKPTELDEDFL